MDYDLVWLRFCSQIYVIASASTRKGLHLAFCAFAVAFALFGRCRKASATWFAAVLAHVQSISEFAGVDLQSLLSAPVCILLPPADTGACETTDKRYAVLNKLSFARMNDRRLLYCGCCCCCLTYRLQHEESGSAYGPHAWETRLYASAVILPLSIA